MKNTLLNLFLLFSLSITFAQNAADVDTSFGSLPGFDGIIYGLTQQPDGKILVNGNFSKYKGIPCRRLVRLNSNGDIDPSFDISVDFSNLISFTLQPDGKIILTLAFSSTTRIARINNDGSIDSSFVVGTTQYSSDSYITRTVVQPDGKIICVGKFTGYNSVNRRGIVRINSDGSVDTTFNPGTGFNNTILSVAVQPDGKIILGGDFDTFDVYTRHKIIRLNPDGTNDLTFSIGLGFNNSVKSIAIQPDGKILVCGYFTLYKNATQNGLIRLLQNGDKDTTFDIGTGFSSTGGKEMKIDNSGNIIIGGQYTSYNGIPKSNCVRINPNGNIDNSFAPVESPQIYSLLIQSDQKIILGGDNFITRLNNNSSIDFTFNYGSGFSGLVRATLIQPDGKIIIGGDFDHYSLQPEIGLLRLNADGTKDNTFNHNLTLGLTHKLVLQPDGKILALGTYQFTNSALGQYFSLVRFNSDGSQDTSFTPSNQSYGFNVALQSDGKILLSGNQFYISPNTILGMIRLNSDGTFDNSFNANFIPNNTGIESIVVQPDDKIIVVGNFAMYNNEPHQGIIRLLPNGSLDTTFNTGENFNAGSDCTYTVLQPDGKILVGGNFYLYNTSYAYGIVRINTDGSIDSSFYANLNMRWFNSIVLQPDGKIIAGGNNSSYASNPQRSFVRFNVDGNVDNTFDIGTAFDMGDTSSYISCLNLQADGKIIVGGNFKSYKSVNSSNLIRLNGGNTILSNENFPQSKLVVSPNPFMDKITVTVENQLMSVQIFDLLGRKIDEPNYQNENKNYLIDLSKIKEKGTYIMKLILNNNQIISKKIIKK